MGGQNQTGHVDLVFTAPGVQNLYKRVKQKQTRINNETESKLREFRLPLFWITVFLDVSLLVRFYLLFCLLVLVLLTCFAYF